MYQPNAQKMENKGTQEKHTDDIHTVIDIRGIQIDIASVLKDVTNSIKSNLINSFDDVFKDYDLYKSTHDALLQIPFVKELCNKNSELSLQVQQLKQEKKCGDDNIDCECECEDDHEQPTITLNIDDSLRQNNDDASSNFTDLTDFLKTDKMNKKKSENDFYFETVSEAEEEEEEEESSEKEEEAEETSEET